MAEAVNCCVYGSLMLASQLQNHIAVLHPNFTPGSNPVRVRPAPSKAILERIAVIGRQIDNYKAYQADRVAEGDNHAVWDSAIDINLAEYEILGLQFALAAIGGDS